MNPCLSSQSRGQLFLPAAFSRGATGKSFKDGQVTVHWAAAPFQPVSQFPSPRDPPSSVSCLAHTLRRLLNNDKAGPICGHGRV